MRIKSQQDFWSGLMFVGVGTVFGWGATSHDIGTAAQMGPGYFPLLLGILTVIVGVLVALKSLVFATEGGGRIGAWVWKPLFFIIAANLVVGAMLGGLPRIGLPAMGLIVGIYALTFIASLADGKFRFQSVFLLATVLAAASYLGFIMLLKLQFQVWPAFLAL